MKHMLLKWQKKKNSCGVHCWQRNFLFHLLARGCIYVAVYATNAQRAKKKIKKQPVELTIGREVLDLYLLGAAYS
jgi:hypothetical protein